MLLVGTLKLEDTEQAVSADEAAKLLPLWQAYRSLSISQTAAEAEVVALLNQIKSTMTADQVQAINAMNLTSSEMMDLVQSMGVGMGPRGTPNPQSTPGFDIPTGGFPSGNPPSESAGSPPSGSAGGTTRSIPSGGGMPGGDPGGVIAGGGVRATIEAAGIKDILTKSMGSPNPINVVKATMLALSQLKDPKQELAKRKVSAMTSGGSGG